MSSTLQAWDGKKVDENTGKTTGNRQEKRRLLGSASVVCNGKWKKKECEGRSMEEVANTSGQDAN